jgi:hypothetical protein
VSKLFEKHVDDIGTFITKSTHKSLIYKLILNFQSFEVLTAETMKSDFYLLRYEQTLFTTSIAPSLNLKMEAVCSPETSVNFY